MAGRIPVGLDLRRNARWRTARGPGSSAGERRFPYLTTAKGLSSNAGAASSFSSTCHPGETVPGVPSLVTWNGNVTPPNF